MKQTDDGSIVGVVTEQTLMGKLLHKSVKRSDPVSAAVYKKFLQVPLDTKLDKLSHLFDKVSLLRTFSCVSFFV